MIKGQRPKGKKPDVKMCLPDIHESKIQDEVKTGIKKDNRKRGEQNIFNVFVDSDASQGVNLSTTKFTCGAVFLLRISGSNPDP